MRTPPAPVPEQALSDRHPQPLPMPVRPTAIPGVTLRPFAAGDLEFLYRVYAASRAGEMALVPGWSEAQKEAFLRFQFRAQHQHYQTHYPQARYELIVRDGEKLGRLYVAPMQNEIRVMDIALLPPHRRRGIGRALMQQVLDEATTSRRFVSLHVEEANPAKGLYLRLGFAVVGEVSFYQLMHWLPPGLEPVHAAGSAPASDG